MGCIEQLGNHRLFTLFFLRPESLLCPPPSLRISGLRTTRTEPQASLTWLGAMDRVSTAVTTVYLLRSPECSQDTLSIRAGAFSGACSRFDFFLWQISTEKVSLGEEPGRIMWVSELIFPKKKHLIILSQPWQVSGALSS